MARKAKQMKKNDDGAPVKHGLLEKLTVRISHNEKLLFAKYLSVLLHAGLAIDEALDILIQQSKGPLKTILTNLKIRVRNGDMLADGFADYPHVFTPVFINLIRAGERSGTLQDNLEHLVLQMEKDRNLKQKIRGAMAYPIIVLVGALILSVGIVVFILPNILNVFTTLKVELPITTRMLIWFANLLVNHGVLVAFGLIALFTSWLVARRLSFVQPLFHGILMSFPIIGSVVRNTNLARICRLMGTMLKSGMPINECIPVTVSVLKNVHYKWLFNSTLDEVSRGRTISSVLKKYPKRFPPMALRMISVGEETGTLPDMLIYLANFYEQEVDDATRNLSTMLEPVLLIVIGLMVGVLALSIVTPIYQILGTV
ncbi:MAG: type II secretion system F family protein [Patescibacteria group bacterium]